jgi:hypothetical protein
MGCTDGDGLYGRRWAVRTDMGCTDRDGDEMGGMDDSGTEMAVFVVS